MQDFPHTRLGRCEHINVACGRRGFGQFLELGARPHQGLPVLVRTDDAIAHAPGGLVALERRVELLGQLQHLHKRNLDALVDLCDVSGCGGFGGMPGARSAPRRPSCGWRTPAGLRPRACIASSRLFVRIQRDGHRRHRHTLLLRRWVRNADLAAKLEFKSYRSMHRPAVDKSKGHGKRAVVDGQRHRHVLVHGVLHALSKCHTTRNGLQSSRPRPTRTQRGACATSQQAI